MKPLHIRTQIAKIHYTNDITIIVGLFIHRSKSKQAHKKKTENKKIKYTNIEKNSRCVKNV